MSDRCFTDRSTATLLPGRYVLGQARLSSAVPAHPVVWGQRGWGWGQVLLCVCLGLGLVGLGAGGRGLGAATAQETAPQSWLTQGLSAEGKAPESKIYQPLPLRSGETIEDILTTQDIPMGQGSFARDYVVQLEKDDQVAIDLLSDSFDTVVTLMAENGTTLGENDDGPDGGTNSLLFMRITQSGEYIVRVRGFGQAKGGPFKLKLTRLEAAR